MLGTIDWSAFTGALTGVLPDATALAVGVVGVSVTATLIFKGVKYVQNRIGSAVR
jgi:hypothetical protein